MEGRAVVGVLLTQSLHAACGMVVRTPGRRGRGRGAETIPQQMAHPTDSVYTRPTTCSRTTLYKPSLSPPPPLTRRHLSEGELNGLVLLPLHQVHNGVVCPIHLLLPTHQLLPTKSVQLRNLALYSNHICMAIFAPYFVLCDTTLSIITHGNYISCIKWHI